ncbi:MAG: hypothetical protein JNL02_08080 [Saprospiraceae bacterium]|nr:hypothetical protein [Saprospiraceae bacterium]
MLADSGGLDLAFDDLSGRLANGPRYNQLIVLKARYKESKSQFYGGKIDYRGEFEQVANQVRDGLLDLIDALQPADLRPPEDFEKFFKSLQTLVYDLDRASQPLFQVNCDRSPATRAFRNAMREKRAQPLHLTLVLACPFQSPNSFAERLILEEIDRLDADADARPYFRRREEDNRVKLQLIPVDIDENDSFDAFRREFGRAHTDFLQSKQQYTHACFAFALHEKNWEDFLPEYLAAAAGWLRGLAAENKGKYQFFVVFYIENLHHPERLTEAQKDKMTAFAALSEQYPDWITLLTELPEVPADEVEKWLHKVSRDGFSPAAPEVLNQLAQSVEHNAPQRFHGPEQFDMFDVEKMQAAVYRIARQTAQQLIQAKI